MRENLPFCCFVRENLLKIRNKKNNKLSITKDILVEMAVLRQYAKSVCVDVFVEDLYTFRFVSFLLKEKENLQRFGDVFSLSKKQRNFHIGTMSKINLLKITFDIRPKWRTHS